jgi:hypothetical protein
VEVIEMSVCEQNQVNRWQMLQFQPAALDALQQKEPIGEVRVYEDIQIGKLHQKRSVPNPRHGHLTLRKFGKGRLPMLAGPARQQSFPDHFAKERAWIEVLGGREIFE